MWMAVRFEAAMGLEWDGLPGNVATRVWVEGK
jgi:hypothetical protein